MQNEFERKSSVLSLENRHDLSLSGVNDVPLFNDEEICAVTDYGELHIKGSKLHVEILDLDSGNLRISGEVLALIYSERSAVKSGIRRFFT